MLIDVLNKDNYITFNVKLAQVFGVVGAVYCSEIVSIYQKAIRKKKLVDGAFCNLDRDYIFRRTTITISQQLDIDTSLCKVKVMEKHLSNPDLVRIDANLLTSIIASEETSLKDVKVACGIASRQEAKEQKQASILKSLKNVITVEDEKVNSKLCDWVESVCAKYGNITKGAVQLFQDDLLKYSSDRDIQLEIIKIAIAQSYRLCSYATQIYEKSEKMRKQNEAFLSNLPRVTNQRKATKDSLGEQTF